MPCLDQKSISIISGNNNFRIEATTSRKLGSDLCTTISIAGLLNKSRIEKYASRIANRNERKWKQNLLVQVGILSQ